MMERGDDHSTPRVIVGETQVGQSIFDEEDIAQVPTANKRGRTNDEISHGDTQGMMLDSKATNQANKRRRIDDQARLAGLGQDSAAIFNMMVPNNNNGESTTPLFRSVCSTTNMSTMAAMLLSNDEKSLGSI